MQGKLNVTYQLICDNDTYKEISLKLFKKGCDTVEIVNFETL